MTRVEPSRPRRRRAPAIVVGVALVACLVVGVVLVTRETTKPPGGPLPAPSAPDPGGDEHARISLPPRGRWFGFSGGLFVQLGRNPRLDQGITPERAAADALAAGANSARVPVSWWDLEPQRGVLGRPYVSLLDRFVRAFERGGGRVLLFLGGTPPWASTRPGDQAAPPRPDAEGDYARFAAFVAARYRHALAIETWNEPNTSYFWSPSPEPARYARMQRLAAAAIRKVAPAVKVLVGGLATGTTDTPETMRPQRFLKLMYAAGLRRSDYDGLAVHPYPTQHGGKVDGLRRGLFAAQFEDFRLGYRGRDPQARVWVTETGVTTSGPQAVSTEQQAAAIAALVRKLLTMPRIAAVYIHSEYDETSQPDSSPVRGFGLLSSRRGAPGAPKPAFCALRRLASAPPPFLGCASG